MESAGSASRALSERLGIIDNGTVFVKQALQRKRERNVRLVRTEVSESE